MKTIEQNTECDIDINNIDSNCIRIGAEYGHVYVNKQGAVELIKVLQERVDDGN